MDTKERTARADVTRWTECVRLAIELFTDLSLDVMFKNDHSKNIQLSHAVDRIWGDTAHWYKAIKSEDLPATLRAQITAGLDSEVANIVRHMRNITEHWEDNRRFFQDPSLTGGSRSVRWYLDQQLVNGPWSWTWTNTGGYELGQVLSLNRLVEEVANITAIFESSR